MTEFLGIFWHATNRIFLLPFFLAAIFLVIKKHRMAKFFLAKLASATHQTTVFKNLSPRKQLAKLVFFCTALFFLFVAILQPQWNKKNQPIDQKGRDLLVLLDISRSMLAQDLKPNRLEFIKLKLKTLLRKMSCERVGLILFSGTAFVQCPLTVDYQTFLMFLDQVDVESISSGTTAIDSALQKAIDLYKNYPTRKNKLALLVTDGEDFSLNLESIKKSAKQDGITVLALGTGTAQGAPIPKVDLVGKHTGYETDPTGKIALSKINESLLKDICRTLNGAYVRTTYDDSDIDYLIRLINKFEKEKFNDKRLSTHEDQYPWLLGVSWFLFALEWVL
ncbi:VWA domain-containing protein [Candidatus Dependentiae bacterium]|nr:VWA domain-containing protein [Candidatus Dependentiae bacterium]